MSNYKFRDAVVDPKFGENTKVYTENNSKNLIILKEILLEDDDDSFKYYKNIIKSNTNTSDLFITKNCIFLNKKNNI